VYDAANGSAAGGKGDEWQKLPKTDMKKAKAANLPKDLNWFDEGSVKSYSEMGNLQSTAQVHPYQFTTSMAELATESGAAVIFGSLTAIDYTGPHGVKGVTYEDKSTKHIHTLPATDIVLAAGPWTSHVFPDTPIDAIRAHSVVFKAEVTPYAVFSEINLPKDFGRTTGGNVKKRRHGRTVSPEMYARPDGTVYACGNTLLVLICLKRNTDVPKGEGDSLIPLPKSSDLVVCDEDRCQDIVDYCGSISTPLRQGQVLIKQACYLPSVSVGGGPLIGETGIRGLFMATGHTCWGIQNSCATGKLISEFVFDGKAKSAKIDSLDPRKFL
jgi:glycine/D-amino acid oxidase-like deaminating enzyme